MGSLCIHHRFGNDTGGFEEVFIQACRAEVGGGTEKWVKAARRISHGWRRLEEWIGGGAERVTVRRGLGWANNGWVYVAPNDVWRFDTGGGKRILGIAREIGQEGHVLVLSWGQKDDKVAFREMGGGVGVLRVPQGKRGEWMAEEVLKGARGWIFVNPLQYGHWAGMRRNRRVVYDAHDEFVVSYEGRCGEAGELERAERRLLEDADRTFFCTDRDLESTRRRYGDLEGKNWEVLPNGINGEEAGMAIVPSESIRKRLVAGWSRPVVLFAGANYGPNYEAVDEISREWAPGHPEVTFVVLGMRMDRYLRDGGLAPAPNVVFTGLVSEEEKRVLYDLAEVAIVPVRRGTGSSLKVPEAIAQGKMVIGTRVGLRGFEEWTKWESVIMTEAGPKALGEVLGRLEVDPGAYDAACRGAAEEMQRRYTWGALMERWRGTWGGNQVTRDERRVTR